MVSKSECKFSSPRSFTGKGGYEAAVKFRYWECSVEKPMWREKEGLMLLVWSSLMLLGVWWVWKGRKVVRWESRKDGGSGKVGKLWEWQGSWSYSRVGDVEWVQDFMVLFLMLIKATMGWDGFKIFLHGYRNGKTLLKHFTKSQKLSRVLGYVELVISAFSKLKILTS